MTRAGKVFFIILISIFLLPAVLTAGGAKDEDTLAQVENLIDSNYYNQAISLLTQLGQR